MKTEFGKYVCIGDTIEREVEGFTLTARIEYDSETRPEDFCAPEDCREMIESWERNDWFYCGVIMSVSRAGITLDNCAASLWGLECNYPGSDNSQFNDAADELKLEALEVGKAAIKRLLDSLPKE